MGIRATSKVFTAGPGRPTPWLWARNERFASNQPNHKSIIRTEGLTHLFALLQKQLGGGRL